MLPLSRNTTYTTSSPPKSVDLNDIQDCIVGAKHGDRELIIPAHTAYPDGSWALVQGFGLQAAGSTTMLYFPIALAVGSRIKSATFYYHRIGGTLTFAVWRGALATADDTPLASTSVATGVGLASAPLAAIDHTMLTGNVYYATTESGAAGDTFYAVSVIYDHP